METVYNPTLSRVNSSNLGVDLQYIAFRIGKVYSAMPPGLVSRWLQDLHALFDELPVAQVDFVRRYQKSNLYTGQLRADTAAVIPARALAQCQQDRTGTQGQAC